MNASFTKRMVMFVFLLGILPFSKADAAHIIGGELSYICLGDGMYEFQLVVYRDCAGFGAQFDDPSSNPPGMMTVYKSDSNFPFLEVAMPFPVIDSLDIVDDPCIILPPNLCAEKGVYTFLIELPTDSLFSYTLVYQRCCRNNTINNIFDPGNTGATYSIELTPEAQVLCNNSPTFDVFPPTVVCASQPLSLVNSASDQEGDSLVYSFCAPFTGGSIADVAPQPDAPPPYFPVDFLIPFSVDNPMDGNPQVMIDSETGLMTGVPEIEGQYVLAICVDEFRDGVLLSRTKREYQFNVVNCAVENEQITVVINEGDSIEVNEETYDDAGVYVQVLESMDGCDSFLTITVNVIQTIVNWDFEDCLASDGETDIYAEFVPTYLSELPCADFDATIIFRDDQEANKHSCTPGINDGIAMCVGITDDCDVISNSDNDVILEMTIVPDSGFQVQLDALSFWEKAPPMFDWINGNSGANNFPTQYSIEIFKDGQEIFSQLEIATSMDWTQQNFDFFEDENFTILDSCTIRVELHAYCLADNGADVSAWDLDDILVSASCMELGQFSGDISGQLVTDSGDPIEGAFVRGTSEMDENVLLFGQSDELGLFSFPNNPIAQDYNISVRKTDDPMNGVSTLDIIRILKHMLRIEEFDSPYQHIAADVNKNYSITAADMVEIRKLLLGDISEFSNNDSWMFVSNKSEMDLDAPFEYTTVGSVRRLWTSQELDFTAVKIGDVNGSAIVGLHDDESESRSTVDFAYDIDISQEGQQVNVLATENMMLNGFQFSADINSVIDVKSDYLEIDASHFRVAEDFKISWNTEDAATISKGDVLFSLILESNITIEEIALTESIKAEAYAGNSLEVQTLILRQDRPTAQVADGIYSLSNSPNPFHYSTDIMFTAIDAGKGELSFYTLDGKLVHSQTVSYEKGLNNYEISKTDLNMQEGILIYSLKSEYQTTTNRMLLN